MSDYWYKDPVDIPPYVDYMGQAWTWDGQFVGYEVGPFQQALDYQAELRAGQVFAEAFNVVVKAERLAKLWLEASEHLGKRLCMERGLPVDMNDTWKLEDLPDIEREGMIRSMQYMLDKGYIVMGPNA